MDDAAALRAYQTHIGQPLSAESRSVVLQLLNSGSASRVPSKCAFAFIHQWTGTQQEWMDYVLLMEALSEPQAHIVQPVLVKFASLVQHMKQQQQQDAHGHDNAMSVDFEFVWLAFTRALQHTNGWIRYWTMHAVIQLVPPAAMAQHAQRFFGDYMMYYNNVDFFSRLLECGQLHTYCAQLQSYVEQTLHATNDAACFARGLMECIMAHVWSPAPCFYYTRLLCHMSAHALCAHTITEHTFVELTISCIQHVCNMQVPSIRTAVQHNIVRSFVHCAAPVLHTYSNMCSIVRTVPLRGVSWCAVGTQPLLSPPTTATLTQSEAVLWWHYRVGPNAAEQDVLDVADELLDKVGGGPSDVCCVLLLLAQLPVAHPPTALTARALNLLSSCIANASCSEKHLLNLCSCSHQLSEYMKSTLRCSEEQIRLLRACQPDASSLCPLRTCLYLRFAVSMCHSSTVDFIRPLLTLPLSWSATVHQCLRELPDLVNDRVLLNLLRSDVISDSMFLRVTCRGDVMPTAGELEDALDLTVEPQALAQLLHVLHTVMSAEEDPLGGDDTSSLLRCAARAVADQRNAESYWTVLHAFVKVVALDTFVYSIDEQLTDVLTELCVEHVLSNSSNTTGQCMLAQQLHTTCSTRHQHPAKWVMHVLIQLALIAPVMRKGERVHEACERDILTDEQYDVHHTLHAASSQRCRVFASSALLHCNAHTLIQQLIVSANLRSNAAQFGLSTEHRLRTRAWCLLLYVVVHSTSCDQPCAELLYSLCVSTLCAEAAQTSIRLLCEQTLVHLCCTFDAFARGFIQEEMTMFNARVGAVASWIHVIMKWALARRSVYALVFGHCLQWVSALNLHVRCTALAAVRHLLNSVPRDQNASEVVKMDVTVLQQLIYTPHDTRGSQSKICASLLEDEYFVHSRVECDEQFIFFKLPHLCGLPEEELLPGLLWQFCLKGGDPRVLFRDMKKNAEEATHWKTVWRGENSNPRQSAERCDAPLSDEAAAAKQINFQKKLTVPVLVEEHSPQGEQPEQQHKAAATDVNGASLVVVASLIDKPSNLGGLCRTCEIFGASQLVVADLNVTKNPEFKSLCVNSDKWMQLEQVNPKWLEEYLLRMKSTGYTLVGVEQMSSSQCLTECRLPARCVLLLGTERQGIPASLIGASCCRLLDAAVEIPQLGVVRSLNVHVCAALVLYEYVRQHRIQNSL